MAEVDRAMHVAMVKGLKRKLNHVSPKSLVFGHPNEHTLPLPQCCSSVDPFVETGIVVW
jgi:hypothetical protein